MYTQTYPQHVLPALNNPNENTGKDSALCGRLTFIDFIAEEWRRLARIRDGVDGLLQIGQAAGANGSSGSAAHRIKRRTVAAAQPGGIYPTPINIST